MGRRANTLVSAVVIPPSTLEERIKRALVPARLELKRIVRRELSKGEPGLKLVPVLVDPNRAALDIGANRGIWAHEMARFTKAVLAFEPNPKLFAILQKAARKPVLCRPEALSDSEGEAELLIPGRDGRFSNQGASLNPDKISGAEHIRVTVRTARLDDLDPPPVGFMKIDVEGHERAVLEGARGVIARDKPAMIIELEERHTGRDIHDELDHVESFGYRTLALVRGQLIDRSRFDADRDHRALAGKPGYGNNFVFLPV